MLPALLLLLLLLLLHLFRSIHCSCYLPMIVTALRLLVLLRALPLHTDYANMHCQEHHTSQNEECL